VEGEKGSIGDAREEGFRETLRIRSCVCVEEIAVRTV